MDAAATPATRLTARSASAPETDGERVVVAVVTPLEAELVEPIRAVADGIEVLYEPDLLPPIRYPGDHDGVDGFSRDAEAERRWQRLLGSAEVLFGLPDDSSAALAAR
jgi:hypothetical protein